MVDLAEISCAYRDKFTLTLQGSNNDDKEHQRYVSFNPSGYSGFRHGHATRHATTVFKAEGASIKDACVIHDEFSSLRNNYVARESDPSTASRAEVMLRSDPRTDVTRLSAALLKGRSVAATRATEATSCRLRVPRRREFNRGSAPSMALRSEALDAARRRCRP